MAAQNFRAPAVRTLPAWPLRLIAILAAVVWLRFFVFTVHSMKGLPPPYQRRAQAAVFQPTTDATEYKLFPFFATPTITASPTVTLTPTLTRTPTPTETAMPEMYFGGNNGVNSFRPLDITDNAFIPPVVLTSLSQEGTPIETGEQLQYVREITLTWPQNQFEFEFAALAYGQPSHNQYAYMLENFDSDWNYIGTRRNGRYTNLPGGSYTLLLKGTNSDGVWSDSPCGFT